MKLLSLDGGGIFGIGQAKALAGAGIESVTLFQAFCGTSIGACIAAWHAAGRQPDGLVDFFHRELPRVFGRHTWPPGLWLIHGPRWSDRALNNSLHACFPGKFGDVLRPCFLTSIDLSERRLKVWNNRDPRDAEWPLANILRRCVAAETYFAPWQGHADAGPFCNCPEMVAICAAIKDLHARVGELSLLSIGTGREIEDQGSPTRRSGALSYAHWLLDAQLQGAASTMQEQGAACFPLKRRVRIQFKRRRGWRMDNPEHMFQAEQAWQLPILQASAAIRDFCGAPANPPAQASEASQAMHPQKP